MDRILLSVVVITKNEENRIRRCLESVFDWVDEIVVVDDESSDRTLEIAKEYTQSIFIKKMAVEGVHRNWAYAKARNNWVLSLDADEQVTSDLREELYDILSKDLEYTGFTIPRRNYIGKYWIRYGGWYPSGQLKLFRKDKFKYEEVQVHPRAFLEGKCGHLTKDIIHYSYRDFSDFVDKLNKQTYLEAAKWVDANRPMKLTRFLRRSVDRFFRSFISKKGYKDGFVGFMVAVFASLYQILSYAKYWEMKQNAKNEA